MQVINRGEGALPDLDENRNWDAKSSPIQALFQGRGLNNPLLSIQFSGVGRDQMRLVGESWGITSSRDNLDFTHFHDSP